MKFIQLMSAFALGLCVVQGASAGEQKYSGDDFRKAAVEYQAKADKARAAGKDDMAKDYELMASIKSKNAKLADENRWDEMDWSAYFAAQKRVNGAYEKHSKDKHYKQD